MIRTKILFITFADGNLDYLKAGKRLEKQAKSFGLFSEVISLDDQVEKNREITIEILTKVIERVGLKDESQILLPAIANRMNKIPFAEQCKLHKLIYDS
jgi:hypothetical protein